MPSHPITVRISNIINFIFTQLNNQPSLAQTILGHYVTPSRNDDTRSMFPGKTSSTAWVRSLAGKFQILKLKTPFSNVYAYMYLSYYTLTTSYLIKSLPYSHTKCETCKYELTVTEKKFNRLKKEFSLTLTATSTLFTFRQSQLLP